MCGYLLDRSSSALELLGSRFGSASIQEIFQSLAEFLELTVMSPFQVNVEVAPLRDVEALWNNADQGARLVIQP